MPRPKSTLGAIVELVVIVAFAIGLALLIQAFVVKPYQIPTGSMIPTLEVGQRVLVQRVSYHFSDPEIGDIVVFHPPQGADTAPRPAGSSRCRRARPARSRSTSPPTRTSSSASSPRPATRSSIKDGHAIVNGEPIEDDFIKPCGGGRAAATAEADHDPARSLLHDGRQPWIQRRQPILGAGPQRLDHR